MNNGPGPLKVTITGGTIDTGGPQPAVFTTPIDNYKGEPLFCKAFVHGSTLVILIDKDGPSELDAPLQPTPTDPVTGRPFDVNRASVTVQYETGNAAWVGNLTSLYRGGGLDFQVLTSPGSRWASLAIRPRRVDPITLQIAEPDVAAASSNSAAAAESGCDFDLQPPVLGYLAIEVDGSPGTLELHYIANPPTVTHHTRLQKAAIIPPACDPGNGSIGGPMGIALTSS